MVKSEMKANRIDNAKDAKTRKEKLALELAALEATFPKETPAEAKNPVSAKQMSVFGRWKDCNDAVHIFHPSGKLEVEGQPEWNGKFEFINSRKTEIKRTAKDGLLIIMYSYDPSTDSLVQTKADGNIMSDKYKRDKLAKVKR